MLRKEWIQVRRDPFTLRMIIALPVMQLFLLALMAFVIGIGKSGPN